MAETPESKTFALNKVDVGIDSSAPSDKVVWSKGRNVRFTPGYVSKTPGKTLLKTLGVLLTVTDSAGKNATGYIKAAGTGETYGNELVPNSDFANLTGVTGYNATLASIVGGQSGNCLQVTMTSMGASHFYESISGLTLNALYEFNAYIKSGSAGDVTYQTGLWDTFGGTSYLFITGTSSGSWANISSKYCPTVTSLQIYGRKYDSTAGSMLFDSYSLKQVLSPSATGVTIVSTPGGTVYNWASIDAGFNPNDGNGYTYTLGNRSGAVSLANLKISLPNGVAFIDFNAAGILTPCANMNVRAAYNFTAVDGSMYSILCTDGSVFAAQGDMSAFTDITPASSLTGGAQDFWEFTIVGGLPILTNGKDGIWKWPQPGSPLVPLLNAPLAKNIGNCMNRLVCSNLVENGLYYPGRIRWSPIGNPEMWTIDSSKQSGRYDLVNYQSGIDAQHNIVCQVGEGSNMYFFTERNLWACDFSQAIKRFVVTDPSFEIVSHRGAVTYRGGKSGERIYAAEKSDSDIYRFANGQKESIGISIRKDLFSNLNPLGLANFFSFASYAADEVWFCASMLSNTGAPDTAYVYNWALDNWTVLDCDFLCHSVFYPPPYVAWTNAGGQTVGWTNAVGSTGQWEQGLNDAIAQDIVGDAAGHILNMDVGFNALDATLAAQPIYGYIESGDMVLGDRSVTKMIEELFPDLLAQTQTNSLMIQVGVRDNLSRPLTWSPAVAFRIGTDDYSDLRSYGSEGAFIRIRFYTNTLNSPWTMGSYSFNYSPGRKIR